MKHFNYLLLAASLLAIGNGAIAAEGVTTLDLTKPLYPETLNFGDDGAWDKLYEGNDDFSQDFLEAQIFIMSHLGYADWNYWEGFAPCTSTDMKSTTSYTVGCMGGGGIVLDESGDVVTDGNGNVAVDKSVPYLVGYYSTMMSEEPSCQILFNDGKAREAVGVYVTNFPTAFYDCVHGNGVARPFVNGDKFTLTIHGVAVDQSEKTVDVDLVKYEDGMLQAIRTWKYVDLSPLGEVVSLYFTLGSTDVGDYGMNTSAYFCMDKLMVKTDGTADIGNDALATEAAITYDRATATLALPQSTFAIIYNVAGQKVMAATGERISVSGLDNGMYFVKTASGSTLRFIK